MVTDDIRSASAGAQLACTVRPWAQFPLDRALSGIRAAGFDAVALPVHGVTEVITPDTPPATAVQVAARIADHDLRLVVLSHAADLDCPEALAALRRQIDHCARLGVSTLVDMGCPELDHAERYLRLMAAAAPYAEAHGVTIAVKPHGGLTRTAADTRSVVDRIGHSAFRICWDPGNLVHYGGEPPALGLAETAPYIAALGLRDHPVRGSRRPATSGMPPALTPGDGIVDFAELFRVLRSHGFTGPAAVENITKLGTVEELDTETARARVNLVAAQAGQRSMTTPPEPAIPAAHSCSLVARAAGQDPIGTARHFDCFLMLELPLPWPRGMGTPVWETVRVPASLRASLRIAQRRAAAQGMVMKTFAAAPDPQYSGPGLMRIVRFDRHPGPAAGLTRIEHVISPELAPELVDALFTDDPAALAAFASHRDDRPYRDLAICTHASVDACCGTRGYPLYEQLRRRYDGVDELRIWRTSSFGGHRFAPTLIDFPEGRSWGNLTAERMHHIVYRSGDPAHVMDLYRGWACLPGPAEQALERELFRAYGWSWIDHRLTVRTVDGIHHEISVEDATGALYRHTAEIHDAGTEPVLIGCDRTVGETRRYRVHLTR